jgi:hypothetical protein
MAPTYGLAEQAADLIRKEHNGVISPNNNSSSTSPKTKSDASHGVCFSSFAFFAVTTGLGLHLLMAL